ncbi:hypothetical protein, partial [Bradyrhizobium sp.]|uniref:hypothetical protein n=1 Tax=Bradyrhizobium sp. TaxID=376 RepID=UPI0025C2F543
MGYVSGLLLAGIIFLWFYGFSQVEVIRSMGRWNAVLDVSVVTIDVLLAYAGGVAIWIIAVTAWEFHYLGRTGELQIRPFHPDKCAGLAPIGQLFFSFSLILVVIALFSAGWLV